MTPTELARIHAELEGIGHVLRDRRLAVPSYQRAYSWREPQVADFWWDLRAAFGSKASQYFLGSIVITEDTESGGSTVIDGQQRLATTVMLLAAFRNQFVTRGDSDRAQVLERDYIASRTLRTTDLEPRLTLNVTDRTQFRELVIAPPDATSSGQDGERNALMDQAFGFLAARVDEEAHAAGRHWAERLVEWVDFLEERARVITVDVSSEADAFLIFETLNARGRELTVADVLKNYLFGLARDELEAVQEHWLSAIRALETTADEEIFTTFVRHHWSSSRGATRERELYARMKSGLTTSSAALTFADDLDAAAPSYAALLSSDHEHWTASPELQPAAQTLLRFGLEQNRPLLLAAMRRFESAEFAQLLRAVISWSVRGLIVGGIGGGSTERAYADAAVLVSERTISTTKDVFVELASVIPTDESFIQAFAQRRVNRTRLAKYYLIALAQSEDGNASPLFVSDEIDQDYRLEAVIPRNPNPEEWQGFPADELRQWALRLGNQYVSDSQGARAPVGDDLASPDVFGPDDIVDRQRRMAEQAVAIWPRPF